MPVLKNLDTEIKQLISAAFRIIIVAYAVSILIRKHNYFEWYIYLFAIIIYAFFFGLLYRREGIWSFLRLLNDYAFFVLVLFGKDINDFHTITILILPIVNSLNHHSPSKRSFFFIQLYILGISTIFLLRDFTFYWRDLVALLAFGAVTLLLYVRTFILDLNNNFYDAIEEFYEDQFVIGQSYRLLQNIKTRLNSKDAVRRLIEPDQIVCFKIFGNELRSICSSDYLISFDIQDASQLYSQIFEKRIIMNHLTKVNDVSIPYNVFLPIKLKDAQYVYFIGFRDSYFSLFMWLYIEMLNPLLSKVTKVIEIEYELRNERKKYLNRIKSKMEFVDNTVRAIHYLNNRLSPVTNYFSLQKQLESMALNDEKRVELKKIINRELSIAQKNIGPIVEKTKKILEKTSNPYVVSETQEVDFYSILTLIRRNWDERNLPSSAIVIGWPVELFRQKVIINEDSLEYVIDEIINNMLKHAKSSYDIMFHIDDGTPTLSFANDLRGEESIKELSRITADFNLPESSELMKKNNNGLYFIKQFLQQMKISTKLTIENGVLYLRLRFNPND